MPDGFASPLHDRHVALGAKLAPFAGWSMPLEYPTGVVAEHTAVRTAVGLFDVSHLGKITVIGPGAAAFVNDTLSNDLGRIRPGQAQYSLCCDDETGGIVDDLIAYWHTDERVLLVPNAANAAEVARRLQREAPTQVQVEDHHHDYAVLAVQGPRSEEVLAALGLPVEHEYMSFDVAPVPGLESAVTVGRGADAGTDAGTDADVGSGVVVCRTGYTGERGYELIVPNAEAGALWDALMTAGTPLGMLPCGLGARDTLRTEMGYPLHGQDIGPGVTPNQARLGWAVGWRKERFWGREALLAERQAGPARLLRGLRATGRAIPRPHMTVALTPDVHVGEVTSGTFSPTLRTGIGLALLSTTVEPGAEVGVDVRGRREVFEVTSPPFVETSVR